MHKFLLPFCLVVLSKVAVASGVTDYHHAEIFDREKSNATEYLLALGGMEKVDGVWGPEKSQRLFADQRRTTFRVGRDRTTREVYSHYAQQADNNNAELLFSCRARACGSSAQWANVIFGQRELYGLDESQFYAAWRFNNDGEQQVLVVYVVQRGNRDVYAQVDSLVNLSSDSDDVDEDIIRWAVTFDEMQLPYNWLALSQEIYRYIEQGYRIAIVGHQYGNESITALISQSRQRADEVAALLRKAGLNTAGVHISGVGPLAPQINRRENRVEILVLRAEN